MILVWHDLDNIGGKWVGRVGGWIPQLPQLPIIAKYHQCYQRSFILFFSFSKEQEWMPRYPNFILMGTQLKAKEIDLKTFPWLHLP